MGWANSKVFRPYIANMLDDVTQMNLTSHTIKVALYDNDITPDNDVTAGNSAYNAGQWVSTGNEIYEAGQWNQGGETLASKVIDVSVADVLTFDAADLASGANADLSGTYGCLVYNDTIATPVAKQGICYNYFGGSNSVVNGTFTVRWSTYGIFRFTL